MDIISKKFIEKFNKFKEERSLTDTEIANKLNIVISNISKYTSGERYPSKNFLRGLCMLYGLDYSYFDAELSRSEYEEIIESKKYKKKEIKNSKYKYNYVTLRTEDIESDVLTRIDAIAKIKNKKPMELVNEMLKDSVGSFEKNLK